MHSPLFKLPAKPRALEFPLPEELESDSFHYNHMEFTSGRMLSYR
jgi:hypothetical protein